MCNLYRQRSGPQSIMDLAKAMTSTVGNLAPGDIYPDYPAPIIRTDANGVRELALLNTIPVEMGAGCEKIKYLSVAPMFAEAIERIYQEISIAKLFN